MQVDNGARMRDARLPVVKAAAICFFFFKQKTAYEIVSRDWSSDVCSSDLALLLTLRLLRWEPPRSGAGLRVLLCISPSQFRGELRTAIARAQQSLGAAASPFDMGPRATRLLERGGDNRREYLPSRHALNLGAGAGWFYP